MLADFLAWIWPALPMFLFAGLCFILAGALWLFVIRRRDLSLGEPDVPVFIEPVRYPPPLAPKAHIRREDADTQVVARIPGATPELGPQLTAVARYLGDVRAAADAIAETTHAIEGLRVIPAPDLGPVCPTCGGPFHPVCPSAPKNAPEETQVVDLCPLTTQDIQIGAADPPLYRQVVAGAETQELSGSLARAKGSAA